jgi:hypothetical protein
MVLFAAVAKENLLLLALATNGWLCRELQGGDAQ